MDISDTILAKSDQLNADDLMAGPVTVTITEVSRGNADQPVNIHLGGWDGRPFKPSKSMRRVLVAAWGKDAQTYVGRSMTLFRDPHVKWAGQEVGGIRISHLSHLGKPLQVALTVTRGKREPYVVQPLPDAPVAHPKLSDEDIVQATSVDALRDMWHHATDAQRDLINARKAELDALTPAEAGEPA